MEHKVYVDFQGDVVLTINADTPEQANDFITDLLINNQFEEYISNNPHEVVLDYGVARLENE